MGMFDAFKKKKPEETIQGSGYTSAYANNPVNTASTYANSLSQGKGLPNISGQALSVPSFSDKQNQIQSIIGQANTPIQGSGYTSNYAQNPSNMSVPKVEQKVVPATPVIPSYIGGYQNLADQKKALLEKQNQQGQQYYQKSYDEKNRLLQESIPALQSQFIRTQGNVQKGIESNKQTADYAKQNAEQNWGTSQRQAAQTRNESEARNRNKFAALGTTSSYGAGSYGQAQENVESDFNRFTQEGLRSKEQNMFEINKALQNYEIDAQTKLDDLAMQLDGTVRQIQSDINMNGLDKQNALDELYNKYQTAVMGVEEGIQGVYKDYYTTLSKAKEGLSFDSNGQPTNQASYEWMLTNPDEYKAAFASNDGKTANKVKGIIEQLSGANTKGITGLVRWGITDDARSAAGLVKQLSSELQIEEAKRLKGQGSMSDSERAILANSISAMNPDKNGLPQVSDARFKDILDQIYQQFGGASSKPSLSSFES